MPILGSFGGSSIRGFRSSGISYNISPSTTSVNEGSSVTMTVTTSDFGTGTLYWTISGVSGTINNTDFSSPASAVTAGGSVSITNNSGSFALTLANDVTTEGAESFAVQLRTGSTTGAIVRTSSTITINDTSITPPTPYVTTAPTFTVSGNVFTLTSGTWAGGANAPTTFTYQIFTSIANMTSGVGPYAYNSGAVSTSVTSITYTGSYSTTYYAQVIGTNANGSGTYNALSATSGSAPPPPIIATPPPIIATPPPIIATPPPIIATPPPIIATPPPIIATPPPIIATPPPIIAEPPPVYVPYCDPVNGFCYSIGADTRVLTLNGYRKASELNVGDELISLDVSEIPTNGSIFNIPFWNSETFTNNGTVTTTITAIADYVSKAQVQINGDWFSDNHYILVRRDGIIEFIKAIDIDNLYEVFNYQLMDWVSVNTIDKTLRDMLVYSIDCEPHDIFFTENMLVYNVKEYTT